MKLRVVFFGSPAFAVPSLTAVAERHEVLAVVSQPDRPAGRGRKLAPPAVKEAAAKLGLRIEQPERLKGSDIGERLAALRPDVFVVVAYGRILPVGVLEVPRLGPWNVHASLLPRYRGAAPIAWAIIRGESRTGVCVMRMEAGLDTGPVADCRETPIGPDDTAGTLGERLSHLGAELLVETLPRIAEGNVTLTPQNGAEATLAPLLRKEDGLLDFRLPAAEVSARARGVDPWPGPVAWWQDEPIKLFSPALAVGQGAPGEVLRAGNDGLVVACGDGAVCFRELQLPGRKRLPAPAVLSGRPIPPGARFSTSAGHAAAPGDEGAGV